MSGLTLDAPWEEPATGKAHVEFLIQDGTPEEVWKAVLRCEDHEIPWRVLWVQDGRGLWLSWEVGGVEELRKVLGQ